MKNLIAIFILTLVSLKTFSQKINGQWRGYFDSKGDIVLNGINNTEFVLELEINEDKVTGVSYSYFQNRRYYVICKLEGTYNKNSKSIKVTETDRIKGNTPPDFLDCFQIHYLSYEKEGTEERLVGKWKTAPGQRSNCGDGSTTLIRRTLNKDLTTFKPAAKEKVLSETKPIAKDTAPVSNNKKPVAPAIASTPPKTNTLKKTVPVTKKTTPPVGAPASPAKMKSDSLAIEKTPEPKAVTKKNEPIGVLSGISFEKRKMDVLQSIEIENQTFKVDLYDNGEVDGDSVSVFYNGKLILSHKRLSEKPISITLDATANHTINELTMYAENLGEIAPNTALMVVTDGIKRYEVRIASDLKNSGTIHFIFKPTAQ